MRRSVVLAAAGLAIAVAIAVIVSGGERPTPSPGAARGREPVATRAPRARIDAVEPAPTLPEPPAAAVGPGQVEVLTLGPDDVPIPGVTFEFEHESMSAETDGKGRVVLDLPDSAGAARVFVGGTVEMAWLDVKSPRTILRFPVSVPIDVTIVDALTGRELSGGRVALKRYPGTALPLAADGPVHRLTWSGANAGGYFGTGFEAEAPAGFVVPGNEAYPPWSYWVNGSVRRGRVVIPAWPAGTVRVRVVDSAGQPVVGEMKVLVEVAGGSHPKRDVVTDAAGRAEFAGIPLVPNESIRTNVRWRDRSVQTAVPIRAGVAAYDVTVVRPDQPDPPPPGGVCGGCSVWGARGALPDGGTASLRLRVLRRDGSPARRARVLIRGIGPIPPSPDEPKGGWSDWETTATTGDDGRVTVEHLVVAIDTKTPAEPVTVILNEPGLALTKADAALTPDAVTDLELREAEGADVDLLVVDADGNAVPWAMVSAEQDTFDLRWSWSLVDGDVQDFAPHTGLDGHFVFHGLPPGTVEIRAEFGGRRATGKFASGAAATLELPSPR